MTVLGFMYPRGSSPAMPPTNQWSPSDTPKPLFIHPSSLCGLSLCLVHSLDLIYAFILYTCIFQAVEIQRILDFDRNKKAGRISFSDYQISYPQQKNLISHSFSKSDHVPGSF